MGESLLDLCSRQSLRHNKIIIMKWLLALISVAVTLFVITQGKALSDVPQMQNVFSVLMISWLPLIIARMQPPPTQPWNVLSMLWELPPTASDVSATSLTLLMVVMAPFATKILISFEESKSVIFSF